MKKLDFYRHKEITFKLKDITEEGNSKIKYAQKKIIL